jgi:hypothetical protein
MSTMVTRRLTTKFTRSAAKSTALSLVLGAAIVATALPARAADDSVPVDTKILRSILEGLGLRKDGEGINYQERAPLVLPPGRNLPPPEKADEAIARNPVWPKDPDVARRKQEADQARNRIVTDEREIESRPLRPDQMTPGGKARNVARGSSTAPDSPIPGGEVLSAKELGSKSVFSKMFDKDAEETTKFTGEPPRASLTAPPPGYQTPSPDQPYGVGGKKAPKATNYYETHGTLEGSR